MVYKTKVSSFFDSPPRYLLQIVPHPRLQFDLLGSHWPPLTYLYHHSQFIISREELCLHLIRLTWIVSKISLRKRECILIMKKLIDGNNPWSCTSLSNFFDDAYLQSYYQVWPFLYNFYVDTNNNNKCWRYKGILSLWSLLWLPSFKEWTRWVISSLSLFHRHLST